MIVTHMTSSHLDAPEQKIGIVYNIIEDRKHFEEVFVVLTHWSDKM